MSVVGFVIAGPPSAAHRIGNISLQLAEAKVAMLQPPEIKIIGAPASNGEPGDSDLPPRDDPESPNAPPKIPSTFEAGAGVGHSVVVIVRALVLESGTVGDVSVAGSSGFAELDALAVEQVKTHWHYLPATSDGKVVRAWISVEVLFRTG